jgi:exonuclease SbcC
MIEKIVLYNFQQFSRLSLELSPTLTTLVGGSRRGKSTVLRALRFLSQGGKSSGLIRHGQDSLRVTLFVDSHKIKRVKSPKENSYQIDSQESYRAVGLEVPQAVKELLQVSDINFQGQLDPPFWLSLSPPDAARELNKIVNLDLIDKTLSTLSSQLRRTSTQEDLVKRRVEIQEKRLQELSWGPLAQRDHEAIEGLESSMASKMARIAQVALLVKEGEEVASRVENASEVIESAERLSECLEAHSVLVGRESLLSGLLAQYESLQSLWDDSQSELEELEKELKELKEETCPLCGRGE